MLACQVVDEASLKKRTKGGWMSAHESMWKKIGEPKKSMRWSMEKNLMGARARRERDLLDLCFAECDDGQNLQESYADISQSATRRPWSHAGVRSLISHSTIYSFAEDRCLIGLEHFLLLGWPHPDDMTYPQMTEAQYRSLSGEAMALPSVAVPMLALMTQLSVWQHST